MVKRDLREERVGRGKAQWLTWIFSLLFVVLVVRLFELQFLKHDYYREYAEENQLQRERIISPRGLIKDRNGEILVDNFPRFDIVLPWHGEASVFAAVRQLGQYLPLDTLSVYARFERWKVRNRGMPFPIIENADKLEISFVRENNDIFPKLRVEGRTRRRYRNGELAAHLLGHVGEVNDQILSEMREKAYAAGDFIGRTGVELAYEEYLRGKDGQRVVAVNASGTVLGELGELLIAPSPGRDIALTIDARLQRILEDMIRPHGSGAAVVMDIHDGGLLAAASLPQFDPNAFAVGIKPSEWEALNTAESKPLFNRFLQATYPPGSTLKVVSAYTILTNHIVSPGAAITYCTGGHRFGNRIFRCWKEEGHGSMDLYSGFVNSCDSYFYEAAERTDVDAFAQACRDFGLGSRTGIELANEMIGLIPDRNFYNQRYGKRGWTQGLMLNNIIGQGECLVTVLQMCRVAAAVANGGSLVTPHVVKEIGGVVRAYPVKPVRRGDDATFGFLARAMTAVVQYGTGRAARVEGIGSGGKTGTAQNPHGEDHAWYVGFAPAENPEIAIAILIENAGHGGAVAAPMAAQLYREYFMPAPADTVLSSSSPSPAVRPAEER